MHGPTNMDSSKLLGFDIVIDELGKGVDFNNPTVGAKLGAKVGTVTTKTFSPRRLALPLEVAAAGAPVMTGLGGRKVASTLPLEVAAPAAPVITGLGGRKGIST